MKRFALLPLLLMALALSACGIFLTSKEKAMRKDPNYQSGYSDGCASANAQDTKYRGSDEQRDDALFNTSRPYRSGWHAGYSACHSNYARDPGSQQSPLPGPTH
ncbi:MAG TPA: hypothetical protein VGM36_08865 [Rhizomicrobium sp.]|jgi:hypothetical protein